MEHSPSIFESFNARSLTDVQVAKTFVPSEQFRALTKRRHTVVLGPRGSGKTTLLKMLQPAALEAWQHQEASQIRSAIDFTGVFIATDISWGQQIRTLGQGELEVDICRIFSISAFTTHVFRALINTFISRKIALSKGGETYRKLNITIDQEKQIATNLCSSWKLKGIVPSFLSIRHALSNRLMLIKELANREVLLGAVNREFRIVDAGFLFLDFIQGCTNAIELFDDSLDQSESKWALMFDELELAPEWITETLVKCMRSTDQRLLFKLALNPYRGTDAQLDSPTSPAPGQDFDQIALWYAGKRDSFDFCTQLFGQLLEDRHLPLKEPRKLLGNSYFETSEKEWRDFGTAYAPGSKIATRFTKLYETDRSFKEYLDGRGFDPKRLHKLAKDQRRSDIRKIAPVVTVREYYRSADRNEVGGQGRRSRKRALLYSGADSIFAVSEGNPRWFIAMIGKLLDLWDRKDERIPDFEQAEQMQRAAERFNAMLKTIPTESASAESVFGIVKTVARFFNRQVVKDNFRPEPVGTFKVDQRCSDDVLKILGQALNAGAIVYVPDDNGQLILQSPRDKRFRVSYLLAPIYAIPIRLGPAINLSSILGTKFAEDSGLETLPFDFSQDTNG
jgi:energy-coupling factor transporter ATP-binding protein EcfA2